MLQTRLDVVPLFESWLGGGGVQTGTGDGPGTEPRQRSESGGGEEAAENSALSPSRCQVGGELQTRRTRCFKKDLPCQVVLEGTA